jgi:propionate CoA-transferase
VRANAVAAHNVPLGVASHMIRDVVAGRAGPVTAVGVGTFVDPRRGGGRLNARTVKDAAEVVRLGGREQLWYRAPRALDAALLRGSSADADGNVSFEREALPLDALNQAMAARNSGGLVIVQVERIVAAGALPTRAVVLPACLVDRIVVAPPHLHWQTLRERLHHLTLSGEARGGAGALAPLPLGARRSIALRALRELDAPRLVVNLGVGMPEGVAAAVAELKSSRPLAASATLTTEAGAFGGSPAPGLAFGASHSADAHVPTASMIDFYNGGGVDVAVLGMAEVDSRGCVNVSSFEGRLPGCGGFIDISQSSKRLIFVGTFTSGGLEIAVGGGRLRILKEGRHRKFVERVREVTFSSAHKRAERVLYVTERAVFRLLPGGAGLELCEVAPGVDAERDVLALMGFRPAVADPLPLMTAECFE